MMLGRGVEKHLQANQGNKPNIQYILEVGIPMLNSKHGHKQYTMDPC